MYYIYILRCADNTLYTGITTNPPRRLKEHITKKRGARYTKMHTAAYFEALWRAGDRSTALCGEAQIKKMRKEKKEELIARPNIFTEIMRDKGHIVLFVRGDEIAKKE